MNAASELAEHLDPNIVSALTYGPDFPFPVLETVGEHRRASVAAVVYVRLRGATVVLKQGMLRPEQYTHVLAGVDTHNADPAAGWERIVAAARESILEEADELEASAAAMRRTAVRLESPFAVG